MNINRDYLIINDVKKSNITLDNGSIFFYITDKNTQNIFVNLVINVSNNDLIQKFANIENAEDYTLTMNIIKPNNDCKIIEGKLHDKEKGIFEFNLKKDCCDVVGTYKCELLTKCNINEQEEITTSNSITYIVKKSILNDLDDIVEAPEYPLVIQLFDKLSDIEQYEEDRRANELARQLAEEQRQARFNTLDADMTNSIEAIDNKVVDVENRISAKEDAVDKLIVDTKADIDDYKVAKDTEINEYKAAKDTEINNAITAQDNKINAQNNRLDIVENRNTQQDNRLDIIETKNVEQDNRLNEIEAIDVAQNSRLDAIESKNTEQDDRLLDIEKVNKRQDMNLKCLFAESKNNMIDIAEEGNSIYLQNSTIGYTLIDEIKGNTLVNCNKEPDKELILNGNINTSGDNTVTITEGVDGGLVDVALEGNTLVNVSKTKESTAITKAYTVENSGNHIALQGDIDGSCRPVITGNTLWINNDTEEILTALDETKNLRLQSSFEDNLVTQEMVNNGEEVVDNLGKYKVEYRVTGKNKIDNDLLIEGVTLSNIDGTETTGVEEYKATKEYISVTSGANLRLSLNAGEFSNLNIICFYDNEYNFISSVKDSYTHNQIVVPQNAKYLRLRVAIQATDVQLEEGTEVTSYEPYKESTKTLYLNSPLLEGDTIEEKDGSIYHVHRYKEAVLDGSNDEGWFVQENYSTENVLCLGTYTILPKIRFINMYTNYEILCDKFNATCYFNIFSAKTDEESIGFNGDNLRSIFIKINKSKLQTQDVTCFKQWLQQNPVTLVYALKTPTYELIEQSNLAISSYANGHLDFSTAIPIEKVDFLPFNEELTYLYANTQYTVQFVSDKATTVDITLGGTQLLAQNIVAGLNRISITTPATLANNKLIISGIGANISEVVVTDTNREFRYFKGMKSVGEGGTLEITSANGDNSLSNTQQLTHEPLRAVGDVKDRYVLIDGKWYIERNCGEVVLDGVSEGAWIGEANRSFNTAIIAKYNMVKDTIRENKITDKLKSVLYSDLSEINYNAIAFVNDGTTYLVLDDETANKYGGPANYLQENNIKVTFKLATPAYEEINYNPFEVYSEVTHITTNSTVPCNVTVKNHGFNCLLKPSTTYTISSNLGLNTVTTGTDIGDSCLRFMDTDTSDVTTMRDVLVLEGDWTTKADLIPANFSGIESAFEQEYDTEKGKYKVNVKVANEDKSQENNIIFYIDEPLRGVDDYKDKLCIKNGKLMVERNCNVKTVDGSENGWTLMKDNDRSITFMLRNDLFADANIDSLCICNLFLRDTTSGLIKADNSMRITEYSGVQRLFLVPTKDKCSDLQSFKQWLQQNPVTVVYVLAEPVYEEVEYNDVKLFIESFKNSTLFYNSNIPVTSKLYYSYSVPIVDTVAKTADVTDQQDSMIIDLATQVAVMEMMLM